MAELGAIVGESGSGKSTSLRNLDPKETFIINVARKALPFKGRKKNYKELTVDPETHKYVGNLYNTSSVEQIAKVLKLIDKTMPNVKQVIIDDSQYLMSFEAMDRASEKGYEKFTQIAQHFFSVLKEAMDMREDLKVFILTHAENTGDNLNPNFKIKTIGKMIDNMITVEGLFTYVLFTTRIKDDDGVLHYKFMTQSDGTTTAKTPMGCFESNLIDNDLQYVFAQMDKYNNDEE
jgi:ABC-type dipeptide/oligopeptide/nickel transport system ATPase component